MKTHLISVIGDNDADTAACGLWNAPNLTGDLSTVDCQVCRRSRAFYMAKLQPQNRFRVNVEHRRVNGKVVPFPPLNAGCRRNEMIYQSELRAMKDWKLKKILRDLRKGQDGNRRYGGGLRDLMARHYEEEIQRIEREVQRRKQIKAGCDCACPEPKTGAAGVSESCPIHAGEFRCITTVL